MILSDGDIKRYLQERTIVISPFDAELQIQPASVDLRLSNEFRTFKHTERPCIDVKSDEGGYTELVKVDEGKPFIVHPKEFVLGCTLERVEIPDDIVARLDGRSSLGRLGIIVHSTAGTVEPGYKGRLTLEITNVGKIPVALYPGMRVCQLSFHTMASRSEKPKNVRGSKYLEQKSPEESKIWLDRR